MRGGDQTSQFHWMAIVLLGKGVRPANRRRWSGSGGGGKRCPVVVQGGDARVAVTEVRVVSGCMPVMRLVPEGLQSGFWQ